MKRVIWFVLLITVSSVFSAQAQEPVDQTVIARIKTEAFQHSQVMEMMFYLTDVHGPRLRGSRNYKAAAEWAVKTLSAWGLSKAQLEPGGFTGRGWTLNKFNVEMTEPQYQHLIAYPLAWSPATKGTISGNPVMIEINSPDDFQKYRGKLRGNIVMLGKPGSKPTAHFEADARRFTEDELRRGAQVVHPTDKSPDNLTSYEAPNYAQADKSRREGLSRRATLSKFLVDEGVAALLRPSPLDSTNLLATDAGGFDLNSSNYKLPIPELAVPSFVVAREHYGRIYRLTERGLPVKLEINLQVTIHEAGPGYNIVAELPGVDPKLKDELVMLGGHFDSWHAGTGATDNAAGSVVMMEAMRILKNVGVKPRRTIRIALWDGEEGGHLGSSTYVKNHFGDPATMKLKPDHDKLAGYFNLDYGTGKIRGVYLQGNEAVRPIFESWLRPLHYLGATTLAIQSVGGTDHLDFDHAGLPGFQFIQDPIDYETRTHHTNLDVYESIQPDDLKQAAVIVASFVYHTAMRDEKLPRKPLPKAHQ
jgi:carboxypeptidase Q